MDGFPPEKSSKVTTQKKTILNLLLSLIVTMNASLDEVRGIVENEVEKVETESINSSNETEICYLGLEEIARFLICRLLRRKTVLEG